MERIISHKYFKYLKYVGLSIILFECVKTGSNLFGNVRLVGTEQEWRFALVLISFILKTSLFFSALLASFLHEAYEKSKLNGNIFSDT